MTAGMGSSKCGKAKSKMDVPALRKVRASRALLLGATLIAFVLIANNHVQSVLGAEGTVPVSEVQGGFIRDWLILGPFPGSAPNMDLVSKTESEAQIRPTEGATFQLEDGTQLTWNRFTSEDDFVRLNRIIGVQHEFSAYAYGELESAGSGTGWIRIRADRNAEVWLNGQEVGRTETITGRYENGSYGTFPVNLQEGRNTCLIKVFQGRFDCQFAIQVLPTDGTVVEVLVKDANGQSVENATVRILSAGNEFLRSLSNTNGVAREFLHPASEAYEIRIIHGKRAAVLQNVVPTPSEVQRLHVSLLDTVSISGKVLCLDGTTPQVAIPVQALRETSSDDTPEVRATVFTDERGEYRFPGLEHGKYAIRCQKAEGFAYYMDEDGSGERAFITIPNNAETAQSGIDFELPPVKKERWVTHVLSEGLSHPDPLALFRDRRGFLWVGTTADGAYRYDGARSEVISGVMGIVDRVYAIARGIEGVMWFGTNSGLRQFVNGEIRETAFNEDFENIPVFSLLADQDGTLWFGSEMGLGKTDGSHYELLTVKDGLPANRVLSLCRARDGKLWIGTSQGVARFDGSRFEKIDISNDLEGGNIRSILEAQDGTFWFGTTQGAVRLTEKGTARIGVESGLAGAIVRDIVESSDGSIWIATEQGVSRYTGTNVVNYVVSDGLASARVVDIEPDADEVIWIATEGGVSKLDPGFVQFTNLDGLTHTDGRTPNVFAIESAVDGGVWVGTEWGGVNRVTRTKVELVSPPPEFEETLRPADSPHQRWNSMGGGERWHLQAFEQSTDESLGPNLGLGLG